VSEGGGVGGALILHGGVIFVGGIRTCLTVGASIHRDLW
jgi:hypothetical protein